jgi:iron complex outermembrane recepter protein
LLYFSFGQGFRDGGLNQPPATCTRVPQVFKPDTLNNFEIGWKTSAEGGRLVWDGALYYMDWQDYQTRVYDLSTCPVQFNANLGKARVRGVESNVSYQVLDGLTLAASGSYNDSHLLSNEFQSATWVVAPGERLPNVPIIAYSASVRYERMLADSLRGFAQFDDAHKGQRWSDLRLSSNYGLGRASEPAYDVANLRIGLDNVEQHWGVEAYITNLTNSRAIVFVNTANYDHRDTTNEPRVFGLRVKYRVGKTP